MFGDCGALGLWGSAYPSPLQTAIVVWICLGPLSGSDPFPTDATIKNVTTVRHRVAQCVDRL